MGVTVVDYAEGPDPDGPMPKSAMRVIRGFAKRSWRYQLALDEIASLDEESEDAGKRAVEIARSALYVGDFDWSD